ncbi:LCP family protein [Solicola gregarius]|uniref:LCP family protein n=1 Tax=Solicola gregarius TaxID=2908642 RepID=A0AA46TF65_9ACTN|nr:LCP family protein [Solicola gregarius]UYM04025.1 LCP family protein [Solicola gregarius]
MPERPNSDGSSSDDAYSWLYDGQSQQPSGQPQRPPDPDATQAVDAPGSQPPAQPPGGDATQAMGAQQQYPQQPPAGGTEPLPPPNLPPPGSGDAQQPPRERPPKPPRRWKHPVRNIILIVVLVWIVFMIAVPLWAWSKIEKVDAEPDGDRPGDQPGTTYLLVGSDSREGLSDEEKKDLSTGSVGGQRTDTMLLMHVGSGPTALISIPRDSMVDVPGEGEQQINGAYAIGGADKLVETIEQNTGIRVDDYVEIGFGGFADIVDALGGIEICTDQKIDDKDSGAHFEKGCQDVDGADALAFSRVRKAFATSDLQRVQNQRQVLGNISDKAKSPWTFLNPVRYFKLSSSAADSLTIGKNVGPISLGRFAWSLGGAMSGDGLNCTVPITGADANTWDEERSKKLFELIADDDTESIGDDICTETGLPKGF